MSQAKSAVILGMVIVLPLGLSVACAGKAPETPASPQASSPEATPPAQAANDPAAQPNAASAVHEAYDPANAAGAVKGVPAPTNTAPIEAVANYYMDLPGFDTQSLPQAQREKLLQRVNSEMCTCGCKNDTLAKCLVNDPKCPTVKGLVQKVYDEVKAGG
ncbi:MAG TPA: hypothetical protein VJV75_01955 [Candidatus Polarisedimenticolia bacterium]|nr:hypothetical protein [Candidatus Polarisedimenticolia bacterium]